MNLYERLENEAYKDGIDVISCDFDSSRIKGLYCNGTIGINNSIYTTTEKSCVLAEELGHHYTSVGDIIDLSDVQNRKQERQARLWAYNKQIGLYGLIRAFQHGCTSLHEIAEYLEVTEQFLHEAIECYRNKYGICTAVDSYVIYFIPNLTIGERL